MLTGNLRKLWLWFNKGIFLFHDFNNEIVRHRPGLNSKPFRSIYVEKAYNAVDSDSSIWWGRSARRPTSCFSRRAGYVPAPSFIFSLPFIINPHFTTQLHYTNSYTYSHPNLNFLKYTIPILVPHVMWSAPVVRVLKIDHTQCHLFALRGTGSA